MAEHEDIDAWKQADALFDQWLDRDEGEREGWLASLRAGPGVEACLQRLIDAHLRPGTVLATPASDLAGVRLGGWMLDAELGRGGMAVVYRASRSDGIARQEAALKVLTLGALGATGRERFQREAEILARLNHPNITPLVDSGTGQDGTCWLAMPLVDGLRIDAWCDSHRLDARGVTRLYLQVCDAVAFAHRNLVIHRDLKPSNVLVEADGHVRLLDFGIGQFADTDADAERTQTLWRALTPGYAAPEQLRGDRPTTAIDIYGLGALLHRLLTGRTPQSGERTTTTRPSLLVRAAGDAYHRHYVPLKNDLDRVLLKALAEEPEHRYHSAEALSDDLRRWLDGRPVMAQQPGLGYRARKFVMRNRLGVAAAVLLATSLAGGIGATLWQAGEARREAANANTQTRRAVLVREFLAQVFESTEPASGGVPTALELLEEGARRARSEVLESEPLAAADILMLTGRARSRLSEYDNAGADLGNALALLREHAPGPSRDTMRVQMELAELFTNSGQIDAALDHARAAIAMGADIDAAPADRLRARKAQAQALMFIEPEQAEAQLRELLEMIPAGGLENTPLHGEALTALAGAMLQAGHDRGEVLQTLEEEQRLWRRIHGGNSGAYAHLLADNSAIFLGSGQVERAGEMIREAAAIADRVYSRPHQTTAVIHCHLGAHLYVEGKLHEAARNYDHALEIDAATGRQNLTSAECSRYRAIVRASLGQYEGALQDLDRSLSLRELAQRLDTRTTKGTCGLRASILLRQNDAVAAAEALEACPVTAKAGLSSWFTLAEIELELARGNFAKADELATSIRRVPRPGADDVDRGWMRPWMLATLVAQSTGRPAAGAGFATELGEYARRMPLSQCLASPGTATCLALP